MATIAAPAARPLVSRFYVTMAAIFVAIAFGGFFETYWLQLARGTFVEGSPLLHLHGLLFSFWTLFFLSQAMLVANRKVRSHRSWGLLGISLATAMVFTGFAVAIEGTPVPTSRRLRRHRARVSARAGIRDPAVRGFRCRGDRECPPSGVAQATDAGRHHRLASGCGRALFLRCGDWRRARAAARSRAAPASSCDDGCRRSGGTIDRRGDGS